MEIAKPRDWYEQDINHSKFAIRSLNKVFEMEFEQLQTGQSENFIERDKNSSGDFSMLSGQDSQGELQNLVEVRKTEKHPIGKRLLMLNDKLNAQNQKV